MAIQETKTRKEIMEFLTTTATATTESDVQDKLLSIFTPAKSRTEMSKTFNEVLGYNPINHYDREEIRELLGMAIEALQADHPDSAKAIDAHASVIVDRALDGFENDKIDSLRAYVAREAQQYAEISVYPYFGIDDPEKYVLESDDDEDEEDAVSDYEEDSSMDGEDYDLNNPQLPDGDDDFQYGDSDEDSDEED